tara:strand:+ start:1087 stop:1257 length:171 start_codon:yes stop_codon:yes gene_type:complete
MEIEKMDLAQLKALENELFKKLKETRKKKNYKLSQKLQIDICYVQQNIQNIEDQKN